MPKDETPTKQAFLLGGESGRSVTPLPEAIPPRIGSKRLFIGLICGTAAILCLALIFGWGIPYIGFSNIHPALPYITGGLLVLTVGVISWSAFNLVLQILTGRAILGEKTRALSIRLFLPISEALGRLLGFNPRDIRRSFIQVNNELVLKRRRAYTPEKLLILLPHCIQNGRCSIRLSMDMGRCKRCGECDIGHLLSLVDHYGVQIAIATGGTIARRIVVDKRPHMILAVACERDLSSGIQDTYPLPVYGVLNERPHGPCRDTRVSIQRVELALRQFIRMESLPEALSWQSR
ncbi:MAG: DUF116 domain-containing protein [Deltaproteobacteria bacterium]|jgi:hypothetical protein|nr:DUF116 domain-containing protein [Deltaproteobacteria bacterium]